MSQVCDCWGLTKKKIEEAVRANGLTDADAVYDHFQGVGCGVCTEDVEAIIAKCSETVEG